MLVHGHGRMVDGYGGPEPQPKAMQDAVRNGRMDGRIVKWKRSLENWFSFVALIRQKHGANGDAPQSEIWSNKLMLTQNSSVRMGEKLWRGRIARQRRTTPREKHLVLMLQRSNISFRRHMCVCGRFLCGHPNLILARRGKMDNGNNSFTILDSQLCAAVCSCVCFVSGAQTCNKSNTHFLLLIAHLASQPALRYLLDRLNELNAPARPGSTFGDQNTDDEDFHFCS